MTRVVPLVLFALVASCNQQQPAAPPANDAAAVPAAPTAKPAVPPLKGNWSVTAIGGQPVAGTAMAAAIGDSDASISAGCLRRSWTYTQDRNLVAFTGAPGGSSNCGHSPSAEEETAFGALGDANLAIFAEDGREATLSGTGGTMTLERR